MQRDYRVYLDDIVEAVSRIRQYAPEIAALEDQKTLDAVVRNQYFGIDLEIIRDLVLHKVPQLEEAIRGIPRGTDESSTIMSGRWSAP